jgi:hypothetical protein
MIDVPEAPEAFFTTFLPAKVAEVADSVRGKSSPGSMTFRVQGAGEWTLRLTDGALVVSSGMADDTLVQITLSEADFAAIFVPAARAAEAAPPRPDAQIFAFKALTMPPERVKLVKMIPGSLAFVIKDGETSHTVVVTPGTMTPKYDAPECRIDCAMEDFKDVQSGKQLPLQLMMSGKMKMTGNAQIPMALSTVLS